MRAQPLARPGLLSHFRLLALCIAGRDEGSWSFERQALFEHVDFHLRLFESLLDAGGPVAGLRALLTAFDDRRAQAVLELRARLADAHPDAEIDLLPEREAGRGYYGDACFWIRAQRPDGEWKELVDGGLTDWTAKLLSSRKERLAISGLGSDAAVALFCP